MIITVLLAESGENKHDATIPVPEPVKKSMIDFCFFIIPNIVSLSMSFTILESPFNNQSKEISN